MKRKWVYMTDMIADYLTNGETCPISAKYNKLSPDVVNVKTHLLNEERIQVDRTIVQ